MHNVNFEIVRIYAGWFDVKFVATEKQIEISASDAWGNDSPKYFLQMLVNLLERKSDTGYVVFDEEPGTYIICIEKKDTYKVSVLYSEFDDDEWTKTGLHGELSQEEIETLIPGTEELFMVEDFSFNAFVRTVFRSFEEYSALVRLDDYEGNWMEFPRKEFSKLSELLTEL